MKLKHQFQTCKLRGCHPDFHAEDPLTHHIFHGWMSDGSGMIVGAIAQSQVDGEVIFGKPEMIMCITGYIESDSLLRPRITTPFDKQPGQICAEGFFQFLYDGLVDGSIPRHAIRIEKGNGKESLVHVSSHALEALELTVRRQGKRMCRCDMLAQLSKHPTWRSISKNKFGSSILNCWSFSMGNESPIVKFINQRL